MIGTGHFLQYAKKFLYVNGLMIHSVCAGVTLYVSLAVACPLQYKGVAFKENVVFN